MEEELIAKSLGCHMGDGFPLHGFQGIKNKIKYFEKNSEKLQEFLVVTREMIDDEDR